MILASHQHYADHLAPVDALLGETDVALVAGYGDVVWAQREGYKRIVLMQHGAGQSYSTDHPNYPGGRGNDAVGLFLAPNEHAAERWRSRYRAAAVEVVGCPRLDDLPQREPGPGPVVAITFHWDLKLYPETRSALDWFRPALADLARRFTVIGTGHPRANLARVYAKAGIEYVPDFREVCRRADVLAFDNTSAGFEFAATGRPVVVMNAPWYRGESNHGLRFWDAASIGPPAYHPADLAPAIERALELDVLDEDMREEALDIVYAYRTGAARRAADAIMEWAA